MIEHEPMKKRGWWVQEGKAIDPYWRNHHKVVPGSPNHHLRVYR
jgi:hypothetical protein